MSKVIVTNSDEIARYATWIVTDTIIKIVGLKYGKPDPVFSYKGQKNPKLPTWKDTEILLESFKKDIENGQIKDAVQGLADMRELFAIFECANHESST